MIGPRRLAALLPLLLCGGCTMVDVSKLPDPHEHTIPAHKLPTSSYHVSDMERHNPHKLKLFMPGDAERAENPGRTKEAMVGIMPHQRFGYKVPVLLIYRDDKSTVAFVSKTWPNRPIGDLVWMNDQLLAFDLYGGETIGWHYILDASTARVIFAAPFADEPYVPPAAAEPAK